MSFHPRGGGMDHGQGHATSWGLILSGILGVPVESKALKGLDSLLSIVQMPAGVPVGTLAIGRAGAAVVVTLTLRVVITTMWACSISR